MTFKTQLQSFIDFIRTQGVVGLAIGFILGGSVSKVVAALVTDIIQPIISLIFGSPDGLATLHLGPVMLGHFIVTIIDFLIIAAIVFFVFKGLKIEGLDKK
jgi:large conductance mechanosensitive channel